MVFGFAQRLDTFVVGSGCGIDMPANRGRANKSDAFYVGVFQENFGLLPSAGYQVDDAVGQPCFFPQIKYFHGAAWDKAGGFDDECVTRGNGKGCHPAVRDHGREIPG